QFAQEVLNAHNVYRGRHSAPPLVLSTQLSEVATQWANHLLVKNRMEHRPNSDYGENIYWASGGKLNGADVVKSWYNEIKQYNWNRPSFQYNTGHFTQVIWKSSHKLGVGYAKKGNNIYVVCNYDPPGNLMKNFPSNVSPQD
ncbi:hypothetical protein KR093_008655, partial [Drosophila rubida]